MTGLKRLVEFEAICHIDSYLFSCFIAIFKCSLRNGWNFIELLRFYSMTDWVTIRE